MQQYEEMNGSPISLTCKIGNETATKVSPCEYKSAPRAENSFAPSLVGAAVAAGERERGLPGRMDVLSIPGEEYYRHCPSRIAGSCGQLPEDWTPADKELWIDGCGRRDYCAAARAVVGRRR